MVDFIMQNTACKLKGKLAQDEVKSLWSKRKELMPAQTECLDLSSLQFADSAGVAFLLEILAIQRKLNPNFKLVAPAEQLKKLIALYDLEDFFTASADHTNSIEGA